MRCGHEAPRSFFLGEQGMGVQEIVETGETPRTPYAGVRSEKPAPYLLRRQERAEGGQLDGGHPAW